MNYYEILGISQDATEDEIKSAFRELAVQKHPDKGGSAQEFIELKTAYDTLKNPLLRKDYDLKLQPESIDNTYNTQYDFQAAETAKTNEVAVVKKIDENYVIEQLIVIARQIRVRSILNVFGGLLTGLAGIILTIATIGFIVFSGLINSGFSMMSRNAAQTINPYTNLFGVLTRSSIPPTVKTTAWIKSKRKKSIAIFAAIITTAVLLVAIIAIK
jgi:curved DNA-binding protein CbpA